MAEQSIRPPVSTTTPVNVPTNIQQQQQTNTTSPKKGSGILKKLILMLLILIILTALVFAGFYFFNMQKIKARDSQRKADLKTLAEGLEKVRQKTLNQAYYPSALTEVTLVKTGILASIPADPLNSGEFTYFFEGGPYGCTATCTSYTLTACLENAKDSQKDSTKHKNCSIASYSVSSK
jgi:hypothetical protein